MLFFMDGVFFPVCGGIISNGHFQISSCSLQRDPFGVSTKIYQNPGYVFRVEYMSDPAVEM